MQQAVHSSKIYTAAFPPAAICVVVFPLHCLSMLPLCCRPLPFPGSCQVCVLVRVCSKCARGYNRNRCIFLVLVLSPSVPHLAIIIPKHRHITLPLMSPTAVTSRHGATSEDKQLPEGDDKIFHLEYHYFVILLNLKLCFL